MSNIPLMYQAQLSGRGQIQYFSTPDKAYDWVEEWHDGLSQSLSELNPPHLVLREPATISWRYVSNSGQDETLIRPVIGAKGYPMVMGSSMKGLFKRACTEAQWRKYCGGEVAENDTATTKPGLLIFYGGFIGDRHQINADIVDIVHEQQAWQVKDSNASHSANIQISLKKPTFTFVIGASRELRPDEKNEVKAIWQKALVKGLGSRTSAGYGHVKRQSELVINKTIFAAYGTASKLPNGQAEFRPNMFKAALRSHTLRLFGGVTDEKNAEILTRRLWGGFGKKKPIVGQLGVDLSAVNWSIDESSRNHYRYFDIPRYVLDQGTLEITIAKSISERRRKQLKLFTKLLLKFSMLLGGFGRTWRRVDHKIFYDNYTKYPIGCHWFFEPSYDDLNQDFVLPINQLSDITNFLTDLHGKKMKDWVKKVEKKPLVSEFPTLTNPGWREVWHPEKVQVWARVAESPPYSDAISWFHGDYVLGKKINKTPLTGSMGNISRIWHRMYPRYLSDSTGNITFKNQYVEILTIFPDFRVGNPDRDFIDFLTQDSDFEQVYP